jgi:uncharacterized protein YjeT (DUF2065 family)
MSDLIVATSEEPKRNDAKPWLFKPGNQVAKGRPKQETVVKGMLKAACPEAAEKLVTLMRTTKDQKLARQCAMDILSYGIGKPRETSEEGQSTVSELLGDKALSQLLE